VTLLNTLIQFGIELGDAQTSALDKYCQLLWEWNTRLNLTRHTNFEAFVTRDLHDSRQLAAHLSPNESLLDIGSGGGVPGIVLAILRSDLNVSLAESTQKKAVALEQMIAELNLDVPVFAQRAEDVVRSRKYDTITARAVAPLPKLLTWFRPHCKQICRLLLIKGPNWTQERDAAEDEGLMRRVNVEQLSSYGTHGRDGDSVILEVTFG